ncbi:hypothetical protein IHE49_01880 [Rhodanobacter sp. 7MK24]|uniref:hypothetical protein n=1 Tax=Rhodanobacter sp. 7MK24 TaxID=2775922 RepID=UPI001786781C|nr:hypothetical protein [Rhodanobacter sp. 7MK24]MBD8879224.1 hypothetical protein [Rhodanobacter sp. 7MK24]
MFKRTWIAAAAAAAFAGAVAWACGPMFPNQLLDRRGATLKAVPQNSFAFEAQRLLPATDKLAGDESSPDDSGPAKKDDATEAKSLGVSVAQLASTRVLRTLDSGDAAYEQGKDLPEDLRLYTAGAVDYAKGDADKAAARFEQVLALPPEQAKLRATWAAYMLGRIHAAKAHDATADAPAFANERTAAAKAFELVRTRAVEGASDTQGLAVASFGDEARLWLYDHGAQCSWAELYGVSPDTSSDDSGEASATAKDTAPACGTGLSPDDLKKAITLYAAQAGHQSDGAVNSLAAVADFVLRQPQLAEALIDSPVPQRLLVAYALARIGDGSDDTVAGAPRPKADPRLVALVQAIEKRGLDHVAGADRLASLAYQIGDYDLAAKLVDHSAGPLAEWLRAKLALQKGDLATAAAAYAAAAKAFPKADDPRAAIEPENVRLVTGEQGVLALARGDYVEAMGHLYDAASAAGGDGNEYTDDGSGRGYGNDAAYVAERVLTVDELKDFVDAHAPASPVPSGDKQTVGSLPLADNLRWLLARRLMREGRYDEALMYFPQDDDPRIAFTDDAGNRQAANLRSKARAYADAMHQAARTWTDIGKAQALYAAAVIARTDGMEILSYQQGPDFQDSDGAFQDGSGQTPDSLKQAYVTDGERQRYAASVARPDYRFHYRYIAADEASQAADLLPPRSQAFAAVLCQATGWMQQGPPDYDDNYPNYGQPAPKGISERRRRADAYYARYVKQGAYVDWASDFGDHCEEPDFNRARALQRSQEVRAVKHAVRRWFPLELGGLVLVVAGVVTLLMRRRRGKAPA